jgi:hypothetical protein
MPLPPQRWLKVVFGVTALVFAGVAIYLYAFQFFDWLESDAAVTAVLGAKVLAARSPIVTDWYYANGDVWGVAPHLLAVLPVAILGLGLASLLIAVLIGFGLEIVVLATVYTRLGGERWLGLFAAMITLMAWSSAHVAFGYIQLSYGFLTMLCMLTFGWFAALATGPAPRWQWLAAGAVVAAIAIQNPVRSLAFSIGPIVAASVWPWRGLALRRRGALAGAVLAALVVAFVVYGKLLAPTVAFSMPRGHIDFAFVRSLEGVGQNLSILVRGLVILCGGGDEPGLRSVPGALLLVGSFVLVIREVLRSRELTALRFVCVIVLAQTGVVLVPLIAGNLLDGTPAVRYLMPSLLEVLGLAAILAVRALGEAAPRWPRHLATAWLAVVPLTALVATPDARPPTPQPYFWPDGPALEEVADEVVRRELTHGYAVVQLANLLRLDTGGKALVCPFYFTDLLVPQRWLADTACFDRGKLPERFFIVVDQDERSRKVVRATLPPPVETFRVRDVYEVYVYRTADTPLAWLELPLPDNDPTAFPLRVPATHLQLRRGKVVALGRRLIATGETGPMVYGPYIKLPRGRYTVRWTGNGIASRGEVKFLVIAEAKDILAEQAVLAKDLPAEPGLLAQLKFRLAEPRGPIEIMVYSQDGGRVALDELVIERR